MSEGIITRRASDIRPLLLDRFRNAAAAYSLRALTLSGQDNPVVKVRRSVDDTEQDFNPAQINDGTLEQFVNAGDVAPADYGTGAAAAYSLRHVSDGYTGDVIRVRESTNNTEQDFNPTEITDGTLLAFCGSGDGLVTTWYDQSGNSNDATQSTANDQPKIVSGGSLVTENSKPAIDFDGVNDLLGAGDILSGLAALNVFTVSKIDSSNAVDDIYNKGIGRSGEREYGLLTDVGMVAIDEDLDTNSTASSTTPANQFLAYSGYDASNVFVGIDGAALSTSTALTVRDQTSNLVFMASEVANRYSDGNIQEAIFYDSDQSSNRELIETNVNHYYSIYSQTNDGFVTTWYDQSGNGNDATQSTAASQPKIVDAGSLVVENGKAALDFDGSDDYLGIGSIGIFGNSARFTTACVSLDTYPSGSGGAFLGVKNIGGSGSVYDHCIENNQFAIRVSGNSIYQDLENNLQQRLYSVNFVSGLLSTAKVFKDGIEIVRTSGSDVTINTNDDWAIAYAPNLAQDYFDGTIQEIIIYPTDQSTKRQQIESNINNHYGIY